AGHVSPLLLKFIGVLGLLTLLSSYLAIGENIRKTLIGDMGLQKFLAGAFVVLVPIFLYLVGLQNFIVLVAITGGFLTAFEWIGTAAMWKKSYAQETEAQK